MTDIRQTTSTPLLDRVGSPDDLKKLSREQLPALATGTGRAEHLKRCHLANPVEVYRTEVLPEIAPDLVEEIR